MATSRTKTSTTRTTASRTAASKSTASKKPAPGATAASRTGGAAPKVVKIVDPVAVDPDLRKKELIDLVVERSGVRKKDAKPAVEAALEVLGEALASGRGMNLQPFGKLRINRSEEKANGRVIVCRLRQSAAGADGGENGGKDPLAEPAKEL